MDARVPDTDPWKYVRTTLVPQDIAGIKPRTPCRRRRSTPWQPHADGAAVTARCGEREWFSDQLFVESQDGHASTGYGSSFAVHAAIVAAVLAYVIAQPARLAVITDRSHLTMPVVVAPIPTAPEVQIARASEARPATAPTPVPVPAPPPIAEPKPTSAAAPVVEPPSIGADNGPSTGPDNGRSSGDEAGVPGGVPGGVVGGLAGGGAAAAGPAAPAVVRVGRDIKAPRKIRDARPTYPEGALAGRGRGSVIIEAVIGPDGKVREVRVVSAPSLFDQAALDAVRQWEYEPPMMNGVAVAVAMTVAVNFSLQ